MKTEKQVKASTQYKRDHKADYGREKLEILYEDQWIIIVNKPSGMLTVPYPGSRSRTALSVLEEMMRKNGSLNGHHKPLVVHRLDRDTSGVMMFALTEAAQKKIMDSWHTMVSERLYRAVAENPANRHTFLPKEGLIDDPLAFNSHTMGYVPKERVDDQGPKVKTVEARTNYTTVLRGESHTLFELSLDTGKKNQIRAHLASKGYPLAGDENYRAKTDPFHRLALHARTLAFKHPFTGEEMKFEVKEPEEWLEYVKAGDKHPATPLWVQPMRESRQRKNRDEDRVELGKKRLSRKDKAHMNFIEQGKRH